MFVTGSLNLYPYCVIFFQTDYYIYFQSGATIFLPFTLGSFYLGVVPSKKGHSKTFKNCIDCTLWESKVARTFPY